MSARFDCVLPDWDCKTWSLLSPSFISPPQIKNSFRNFLARSPFDHGSSNLWPGIPAKLELVLCGGGKSVKVEKTFPLSHPNPGDQFDQTSHQNSNLSGRTRLTIGSLIVKLGVGTWLWPVAYTGVAVWIKIIAIFGEGTR